MSSGRGHILNPALTCTITRNDPDGYLCAFVPFKAKHPYLTVMVIFSEVTAGLWGR